MKPMESLVTMHSFPDIRVGIAIHIDHRWYRVVSVESSSSMVLRPMTRPERIRGWIRDRGHRLTWRLQQLYYACTPWWNK